LTNTGKIFSSLAYATEVFISLLYYPHGKCAQGKLIDIFKPMKIAIGFFHEVLT
jgi:hypothetical protein